MSERSAKDCQPEARRAPLAPNSHSKGGVLSQERVWPIGGRDRRFGINQILVAGELMRQPNSRRADFAEITKVSINTRCSLSTLTSLRLLAAGWVAMAVLATTAVRFGSDDLTGKRAVGHPQR